MNMLYMFPHENQVKLSGRKLRDRTNAMQLPHFSTESGAPE
jgi:hypothetical protein